jgi:CheY-like chemotaxis protein
MRSHGRVLVADDSSDGRRMIADILSCLGLDVTLAENGRVACDLAISAMKANRMFDLILMDSQMPVADGYQATAQLRSKGYSGRIVALTSGGFFDEMHARSPEVGFNGYAHKPITFPMLRDVVRRHLPVADAVMSA